MEQKDNEYGNPQGYRDEKEDIGTMSSLETNITQLGNLLLGDKSGHLYRMVMEKVEKPLFEHILARTAGNQLRAAKILGINRNTMRSKIKKLGIQIEKYRLGHG